MKRIPVSLLLLLLAVIALITYSNHFYNSFHFDDSHTIVSNLEIRSTKNIPRFFTDATTMSTLPANQSYRPLVTTSTAIDFYLSGSKVPTPFMFHVTNFVTFLLLGLLCYYLFVHFLGVSMPSSLNWGMAFFTTAWFLLHAANAETVNYIIARSDILSTLFIAGAFVVYIYGSGWRKYYLYLLPVLAGLLSKELAVMFVPLLFFYKLFFEQELAVGDWWKERRKVGVVIKEVLFPLLVVLLCFIFVRKMTSHTWTPGGMDRWKYIFTQPFVVFHYCYNFFVPVNLVVDTDWTVISSYSDDRVLAGLLFMAVLVVFIFIASKKKSTRPVAFGIAWFLLALAPTSLMPFAEVLNDHRTFFPYIGLFIAMAVLLRNFLEMRGLLSHPSWKRVVIVAGVVFLGLHAAGTHERNRVWATEESLWKEATQKAPMNGRVWMNYGVALLARGDFAGAQRCFYKTVDLWPNYSFAYTNLGIVKQSLGELVASEQYFKKALTLDAQVPQIYGFYSKLLMKTGRYAEADSMVQKGLSLSPNLEMLLELKDSTKVALQKKAAEVPTAESWLSKSLQFYNIGQFEHCIEAAQASLKLRPGYDLAYNNICAAYNKLKQYDHAIAAGEQGLQLNPGNQLLKGNLAVARRGKGK